MRRRHRYRRHQREWVAELAGGSEPGAERVGAVGDSCLDRLTIRQAAGQLRKLDQVAAAFLFGQGADLERGVKSGCHLPERKGVRTFLVPRATALRVFFLRLVATGKPTQLPLTAVHVQARGFRMRKLWLPLGEKGRKRFLTPFPTKKVPDTFSHLTPFPTARGPGDPAAGARQRAVPDRRPGPGLQGDRRGAAGRGSKRERSPSLGTRRPCAGARAPARRPGALRAGWRSRRLGPIVRRAASPAADLARVKAAGGPWRPSLRLETPSRRKTHLAVTIGC